MKELCIDARMLLASGIGTYLRNLLPLLKKGNFHIQLIVNRETIQKVPWVSHFELIKLHAPIYSLQEQIQLPLKIPRCDLFWSPHYNIPLLPIAAKNRLVTIHDAYHLAFRKQLTWPQKIYAATVMKWAVSCSRKVITVSEFSKQEICHRTKLALDKITVIHPGVDHKQFPMVEDGLSSIARVRYRLPPQYLLFVGNVKPHKNLQGLLQAFLHAGDALANYHLVVVGKRRDFYHADLLSEELAQDERLKERVHFLDFVEQEYLPSLYRLASATIIPSLYEGFGSPAVEAMSSGSPLAVSNVASLPEVCGDAAVYFDPHQIEDIARVLVSLLRQPQLLHDMKEKGYAHSRKFCWEKCAEQHLRVMEEMC